MEVAVAQTAFGQPIDIGRLDRTAEAADMTESHIVKHNVDDIGCPLGRLDSLRPAFSRVFVGQADLLVCRSLSRSARNGTRIRYLQPE